MYFFFFSLWSLFPVTIQSKFILQVKESVKTNSILDLRIIYMHKNNGTFCLFMPHYIRCAKSSTPMREHLEFWLHYMSSSGVPMMVYLYFILTGRRSGKVICTSGRWWWMWGMHVTSLTVRALAVLATRDLRWTLTAFLVQFWTLVCHLVMATLDYFTLYTMLYIPYIKLPCSVVCHIIRLLCNFLYSAYFLDCFTLELIQ